MRVAPSNPSVVYEVTSSPQLVLRRTAADGTIWQSFELPVQNATNKMQLYVSPLNPNVVVLHTTGWVSQLSSSNRHSHVCGHQFSARRWARVLWQYHLAKC